MKQQIAFLMEIDKVKNIFRQTYLADGKRKENDAEQFSLRPRSQAKNLP